MGDGVEAVEDEGEDIGEDIHEDGDPENPCEVASVLCNNVGRGLADKSADFLDTEFETEGRGKTVVGREPGAKNLVLGDLGCDVTEGKDDSAADHELEVPGLGCGGNDDGTDGVDDVTFCCVSFIVLDETASAKLTIQHGTGTTDSVRHDTARENEQGNHEIFTGFKQGKLLVVDVELLLERRL